MEIKDAMSKVFSNLEKGLLQTDSEMTSRPLRDEVEHSAYMLKLWVVMSETYGHKWTTPMGEKPNQTWVESLRDLTDEQWGQAVSKLRHSTDEWPPSLPEFRRWAIGGMTKDEMKVESRLRTEARLAAEVGKYNPFATPMTTEQYERRLQRESQQEYVVLQENERREAQGLPAITDPKRICQDEDYR